MVGGDRVVCSLDGCLAVFASLYQSVAVGSRLCIGGTVSNALRAQILPRASVDCGAGGWQDWLDAASVAEVVGVDIEAVNFAAEYKDRVFADFLREYSAGRTPNPDVLCNAETDKLAKPSQSLLGAGPCAGLLALR